MGTHRNKPFQQDWSAFGESNFIYEILYEIMEDPVRQIDIQKELKSAEKMYREEMLPGGKKGYYTLNPPETPADAKE